MVMLRVDTSGDPAPGGIVTVARRVVGSVVESPAIVPAGYLAADANVELINGSGLFFDTTVPLDTAVEYLGGLPGGVATVAAGPVTVVSSRVWRLGDPLRPYLDVPLIMSRTSPTACPVSSPAIIMLSLGDESINAQSDLSEVAGRRTPFTVTEPLASPSFEVRFATRTQADREAAEALLAPGSILLLRPPDGYQMPPRYLSVRSTTYSRISSNHRKQWRTFTCQVREVDPPAGAAYGWLGTRWDDLCSGGYATWLAMVAAGLSWDSLGYGVGGGGLPAAMRTWTEVLAQYPTWANVIATGDTWHQLTTGV